MKKLGLPFWLVLLITGRHLTAETVRYTVSLQDAAKHIIHVRMEVPPKGDKLPFDLQLPVWNALYQVRDFAQYVQGVQGSGRIRRISTHRWQLNPEPGLESKAFVEYDTVANLPGTFGFQFDEHHAYLNLAECLMYSAESRRVPVEVRFTGLPAGWKIATALQEREGAYLARNYDHLVDSPIEMGAFQALSFRQLPAYRPGNPRLPLPAGYRVVVHSEPVARPDQLQKLREIIERVLAWQTQLMDGAPFETYTFIYHFTPNAGGGMEHADSTAIGAAWPEDEKDPAAWQSLASITAHEFFHLWNVKRIRPQSLEPVDYSAEQPTPSLWFSEGFTSTYAAYTLLRTGMITPQRFLEQLQDSIYTLEQRPATHRQPAYESSLETWFDKYPTYGTPDRSISYYQKGEIAGFLLDLTLRQATGGRKSLDDFMRLMNERYGRRSRYFDEDRDIQKAAEDVAGQSLQDFFDLLVRSAATVDYNRYLAAAGLKMAEQEVERTTLGFTLLRRRDAPWQVGEPVPEGLPLKPGDLLLEINGRPPQRALSLTRQLKPGDEIHVKFQRDGKTMEVRFPAARIKTKSYVIAEIANSTDAQRAIRAAWLASK